MLLGKSTLSGDVITLQSLTFRLARISLLIVIIFIICHSLKILPSIFEILGYPPEVRNITCHTWDIISFLQLIPGILQLSHLLLTINCSVNFLVYYLAGGRALSKLLPGYSIKSYISNNNESFFLSGQYSEMGKSLETIVWSQKDFLFTILSKYRFFLERRWVKYIYV